MYNQNICRLAKSGLILTNRTFQPMISAIESITPILYKQFKTIVDVRSPSEYAQGHIPGSHNIPLFTDEERSQVGTLYTKVNPDEAFAHGLDIAIPKVKEYLRSLREVVLPQGRILVHCWRGGLRSVAMAEVFRNAGFEVFVLQGGYKAFRHYLRERLSEPRPVFILGGFTGSGKTEILHALQEEGEQIIDLERLACHKGSVFGALGQPVQPTNEQFENNLGDLWLDLNPRKPLWIEDESRMIGNVTLPEPINDKLCRSVMIRLKVDTEFRIERLVHDYAQFDKSVLAEAIQKIRLRLGGTETKIALDALWAGDFQIVAGITLKYYDKAYQHTLERRRDLRIYDFKIEYGNACEIAQAIKKFVKKITLSETDIP
ncbi:MAG: tRNA 2-selenouridine(34) synthase MnmH [Alphaproteobacteria bacterium]|nr:tRNA 2-selenouridine(34) synthase MnmH [Alphaproteobacteria bacterium]